MGLKERAQQLKTEIPAVFLALRHQRTPWYAKAVAFITVAYALSPVDLVPDFIPILGYLDDVLLLPLLVKWVIQLIPPDVLAECRAQAAGLWVDGKPKKWYYAIPIVLLWLLIVYWIVRAIFRARNG
ncbi:MAG: DUF1232 domain-containing protein [Clostridia bacterium]